MKVLHLLGATEDHGGIVSVVRGIQAATTAHGVRHLVWVNSAFENRRSPSLELRKNRFALDESAGHSRLLLRAALAMPELLRLLRRESADVIHAHTRGGFAVAMLLNRVFGRRLLFTNHTYATRTGLYRHAAQWPGFNTVLLTPNMAKHYGLEPDGRRISIISECGADAFWEAPLHAPPQCNPLRLAGVGNIVRWKNWHLVLDAIGALPSSLRARVTFDLWGPTPKDEGAKGYARELQARVEALDLVPRIQFRGPTNDVVSALQRADWFILPSTNEPCSVALIEALALGMPAIVSRSGGNVDLVQDRETGLLFTPDDSAELKRSLARVIQGETSCLPAAALRQSVANRSATAVGQEYLVHYRGMLGTNA